jgi:hypothetical protein
MKHAHYLSSYYLHELISKVSELKREDLYTIVQKVSFNEVARKNPDSFRSEIEKELKLLSISITLPKMDENEIRRIYLKHVDKVFTRALE